MKRSFGLSCLGASLCMAEDSTPVDPERGRRGREVEGLCAAGATFEEPGAPNLVEASSKPAREEDEAAAEGFSYHFDLLGVLVPEV
jgi:hypothetical protein